MRPLTNINFELWFDDAGGKCYAEEFLDSLGDVKAEQIAQILDEHYGQLTLIDLIRDQKIRHIPERPGLYYIRINLKKLRVRLFGCLLGNTMWLVHGVTKEPLKELSIGHYETAESRIKTIK
jgi:hypothetical protein